MEEKLKEVIQINRNILVITEDDYSKILCAQLKQFLLDEIVYINIPENRSLNYTTDKKYVFIINGFGEDSRYENIYQRFGLDKYDAKVIVVCRPSVIVQYRDPSLFFVPIKNGRLQKKLFVKFEMFNQNKNMPSFPESKVFVMKQKLIPNEQKVESLRDHYLNKKLMTLDSAMMSALADRVQESEKYKKFLFKLVSASAEDENLTIASANSITTLKYAKICFSEMNLSYIKIRGADLSGGIFDGTIFDYSDLRGVNFSQSYLCRTSMIGVSLDGVEFGEFPQLSSEYPMKSICYSPDNEKIITGDSKGNIQIWSTQTFECEENYFNGTLSDGSIFRKYFDRNEMTEIRISPNGKYLAVASHCDGKVRVWDFGANKLICTFEADDLETSSIDFHPDSNLLISSGYNRLIQLWDIKNNKLVKNFVGHTWIVHSVRFHPNGQTLASGCRDGVMKLWHVESGLVINDFIVNDIINCVAFSCDGKFLAASTNNVIKIFNVETYDLVREIYTKGTTCLSFSHKTNTLFATGNSHHEVLIWDLSYDYPQKIFYGHRDYITQVQFNRNDNVVISSGNDGSAHLWKINNVVFNQSRKMIILIGVNYTNDRKLIAAWYSDNSIKLWDGKNFQLIKKSLPHQHVIVSLSFSPDSNILVTDSEGKVMYWDVNNNIFIPLNLENISYAAFLNANTILTIEMDAKNDYENFEPVLSNNKLSNNISFTYLSGDRIDFIPAVSKNVIVKIFSIKTLQIQKIISGISNDICSFDISMDSSLLAIGYKSSSCLIEIWNLEKGTLYNSFKFEYTAEGSIVKDVCISPDNKILASAHGKLIRLWDIVSGKEFAKLIGHTSQINRLNFSVDGSFLVSGSGPNHATSHGTNECSIKVWNIEERQCIVTGESHHDSISTVLFSENSEAIISADTSSESFFVWKFNATNAKFFLQQASGNVPLSTQRINLKDATGLNFEQRILLGQKKNVDNNIKKVGTFFEKNLQILSFNNIFSNNSSSKTGDKTIEVNRDNCCQM